MLAAFYLFLTYMVASFPTGMAVAAFVDGTDIRRTGSGNIGATNVTRLLGPRYGALTLLGDALKGFLFVALAPWVLPSAWFAGLVALVAFAGHCWSAYLEFRGGKGVATAAGATLALAPWAVLGATAVWAAVVKLSHKASVGALIASPVAVALCAWLHPHALWVTIALTLGIVLRHRTNIRRLLAGTER